MNRRQRQLQAAARRAELHVKWGAMMIAAYEQGQDGLPRVCRDVEILRSKNPQSASEIDRAYRELPPLVHFLSSSEVMA